MKKISKMNEAAWVLSILLCAFGVALSTKSGLGLSMISAPPYIMHVMGAKIFPWFTQGVAEYLWQAILLGVICLITLQFKVKYLLSIVAVILYGLVLDGFLFIMGGSAQPESFALRVVFFILGEIVITLAIAFVFNTYLIPTITECVVVSVSERYGFKVNNVKTVFDLSCFVFSLILAVIAYFVTGDFVGVGVGTVILTFINSPLIRLWGKILDKLFVFDAAFPKLERMFKR